MGIESLSKLTMNENNRISFQDFATRGETLESAKGRDIYSENDGTCLASPSKCHYPI